jgi:hypothetical protein
MQTFLPYKSFEQSAKVLDWRRLGKQRVECKQLLQALLCGPYQVKVGEGWLPIKDPSATTAKTRKTPWINHPAAKMWQGYEDVLVEYAIVICKEWIDRGYYDSLLPFFLDYNNCDGLYAQDPPWLGNDGFHASHRSNLLRKDPIHYGQFGWDESPDMPYVWGQD